ncbi:MAG TPA: hypothetical protein VNO82_21175 [Solirubrobacteraceae bacterium]|nr:hypothetical protein [Solirubrobacteraceae bacterium]
MTRMKWIVAAVAATCAIGAPVAVAVTYDAADQGTTYSSDLGDAKVAEYRAQRAAADLPPLPTPHPLTGEGENMEIVANVPIDFGADIEMHGDYAYVSTFGACSGGTPPIGTPFPGNCTPGTGGVTVIDISDPTKPERVGLFDCAGGQNDVQLSPDGKWLAMAIESRNNACHPGLEGSVIVSLADPENPVEVSFVEVRNNAGTLVGSHNHTLDWPYLYIDQYVSSYNKIDIYDLTNPAAPVKLPGVQYGPPAFGSTSPHDLIVDHRPDGKDYLYASSGNQTSDVIDVTDPANPVILQRLVDPAVDFAHQSEPNHDRSLTLITDEYRGGNESRACGKTTTQDGPRDVPVDNDFGDRNNLGALYFYETAADGLVVPDGTGQPKIAGTYNLPLQTGDIDPDLFQGCTIHIFWTAPDENRLVTSFYGRGTRVVDFENPARAKEMGWFIPTGADTWSSKPHNGYIFTGDIARGFDVLRYTGERGNRWPSTAGPAEVQRAKWQGAPAPEGADRTDSANNAPKPSETENANPGPARVASPSSEDGFADAVAEARNLAGATFSRTVKLGRKAKRGDKVVLTIRTKGGSIVSRVRAKAKAGKAKLRLRAQITGVRGTYRYTARFDGRNVAKGRFKVAGKPAADAQLKANETLVCRIIS